MGQKISTRPVRTAASAREASPDVLLRAIIAGTASTVGGDFFRALVRNVALALNVRIAFVSEIADDEGTTLRLLAIWKDDRFEENIEYSTQGTPCRNVIGRDVAYFADDVQKRFPDDEWLRAVGARSYLAVPLFASDTTPLGHLGIVHDEPIDRSFGEPILRVFADRAGAELERERFTSALEASKERLAAILENAPVGMLRIDAEGTIGDLNNATAWMFGYERRELIGQPLSMLIPEHLRDEHETHRESFMRQPSTRSMGAGNELTGRAKDGTLVPIEVGLSHIEVGDDKFVVAFISDVSRLRGTLQKLEESEARLGSLMGALPDMLFVLNVEGRFVDYVPADGAETVVPPDEFLGKSVEEILPPEVAKGILDKVKRTLRTGHVQHLDFALELPDGTHSYHDRFVPYARDEVIVIAVDKTAELEVEQEQGRRGTRDELADRVEQKMTAGANRYGLTFREFSVLQVLKDGTTDKEIGVELGISVFTVNKHVSNILTKMNAASRTEAIIRALEEGLIV